MKSLEFSSIIKASLMGVIITVIGVLILAGAVKLFSMSEMGIKTANQFIKTISIFLGCITCLKKEKGLIKGLLVGIISCVVIHLLFAILGSFIGFKRFFLDLAFCLVVGIISGIISINLRSNHDI